MKGTVACFSLGSNMGDRIRSLERAARLLRERVGPFEAISGIYESSSWGYESDHRFVNSCLAIRTDSDPLELLDVALGVEQEMGRIRGKGGYSDRVIDVDLLLMGDLVLDHPRLVLPHPKMSLRRFVLVPLAEIVPEMQYPGLDITISELLERCEDQSPVIPV